MYKHTLLFTVSESVRHRPEPHGMLSTVTEHKTSLNIHVSHLVLFLLGHSPISTSPEVGRSGSLMGLGCSRFGAQRFDSQVSSCETALALQWGFQAMPAVIVHQTSNRCFWWLSSQTLSMHSWCSTTISNKPYRFTEKTVETSVESHSLHVYQHYHYMDKKKLLGSCVIILLINLILITLVKLKRGHPQHISWGNEGKNSFKHSENFSFLLQNKSLWQSNKNSLPLETEVKGLNREKFCCLLVWLLLFLLPFSTEVLFIWTTPKSTCKWYSGHFTLAFILLGPSFLSSV